MEQLFSYEFAKETLVMCAFYMLILWDIYWLIYLIRSAISWCFKTTKKLINRMQLKYYDKK